MFKNVHFLTMCLLIPCATFLLSCAAPESAGNIALTISPDFFRLPDEGGRVQFKASLSGTLDQQVTWSILSGPGTIDPATGLYTSDSIQQLTVTTVQATSNNHPEISGNARIGLTKIKQSTGEILSPGVLELAVGGLFVDAGQTIDLTKDQHLDLLARNADLNQVSFLKGNGNNTFEEKIISLTDPVAMVVGDFIANGVNVFSAEVAVASGSDQTIYFMEADITGQPQLSPSMNLPLGQTPVSLATGKFHDGHRSFPISDLIVGTTANEIVFFRQDRSALPFTMMETGTFPVGGLPSQMVVADFDQNNRLDLSVVREGSNELFILFGDGDGHFTSNTILPFAEVITQLRKGDFNGDEVPDLVAAHASSNQISVILGKGDGSFGTPEIIDLDEKPGTMSIGDYNVGTKDDIAIALPASNEIFILFGDGQGKFPGNWRFNTSPHAPMSLISGFFSGFNAPQGDISIDLIYMGIDPSATVSDRFFLLTNENSQAPLQ